MWGPPFTEVAALPTCRDACFRGNPTALAASPAARAASDGLHALVHNYHDPPMARIRHHTQACSIFALAPILQTAVHTLPGKIRLLSVESKPDPTASHGIHTTQLVCG